jgi:hypothetical protein
VTRAELLEAVASSALELRLARRNCWDTGLYRMDEAPPEVKRAAEACDALDKALAALDAAPVDSGPVPGCADNSCVVARRTGMGTNGGCRCDDRTLRRAVGYWRGVAEGRTARVAPQLEPQAEPDSWMCLNCRAVFEDRADAVRHLDRVHVDGKIGRARPCHACKGSGADSALPSGMCHHCIGSGWESY